MEDAEYFRRYHAYIVLHGKRLCRPRHAARSAPWCAIATKGSGARACGNE